MNSSAQMIFDMSDVESKENIPQKKLISKYDFSQVFEGQINNEYHNNNSNQKQCNLSLPMHLTTLERILEITLINGKMLMIMLNGANDGLMSAFAY